MNIIYGKKLKLPIFPVIPFASNVTTNKLKVVIDRERKVNINVFIQFRRGSLTKDKREEFY